MWNSGLSKACLALSVLILFIGFASPLALADYSTVEIDGRTWTTNDNFEPIGSPDAVHGGELRTNIPNFLPTLRRDGPNSNLTTITDIYSLTHEFLLSIHPETLEWLPRLASHWIIEEKEDHQVFW